jgi:putative oxidoreductase
MNPLAHSSVSRFADLGPLALRLLAGIVMTAHGAQKLFEVGPAKFGSTMLADLGVPAPTFFGYVVTFVELFGGIFLIIGLLSRLASLLLTFNLLVALVLVKLEIGLIAPMGSAMPGAELDLALIATFLGVLFVGPGRLSVDYLVGLDRARDSAAPAVA